MQRLLVGLAGIALLTLVVFLASLTSAMVTWAESGPLAEPQWPGEPSAPPPPQLPGRIEAVGTHFAITNTEYASITLDSAAPITLSLQVAPEMVMMRLEAASGAASTPITLTGFAPLSTYHKYEDDYHNHEAVTTDASGGYAYVQDLSRPHLVMIQAIPSTKFIRDDATGGDCQSIGSWELSTKTCTLTTDLDQTIQIDSDNVTLDGGGHAVNLSTFANGVFAEFKRNITIRNLTVSNFFNGIYVGYSANITLTNNVASAGHEDGIVLSNVSDALLTDNIATGSRYGHGINIAYLNRVSLSRNAMSGNRYNFSLVQFTGAPSDNSIDTTNTVDGKPIYYVTNASNQVYDASTNAGIIYLIDSSGVTIRDLVLTNNRVGVYLLRTENSRIENVQVAQNESGIVLDGGGNNILSGNEVSSNYTGLDINSNDNILTDNTFSANSFSGIRVSGSGNALVRNSVSSSYTGISVRYSSNTTLTANTASSSGFWGFDIGYSTNVTLSENLASYNPEGIQVVGSNGNTITHNTVSSNTVGFTMGSNSDSTIANNVISRNGNGIAICCSTNTAVVDNSFTSNWSAGLHLSQMSNTTVRGNGFFSNGTSGYNGGLRLVNYSTNNTIYHNDFVGNLPQVSVESLSTGNIFNLPAPVGGNHWGNYDAPAEGCNDLNGDGFCDAPYVFSGGQDALPWIRQGGWLDGTPPTIADLATSPNPAPINTAITLSATISDLNTGGSAIVSATYHIDSGPLLSFTAVDGRFDGVTESVVASIAAFGQPGVHNLCAVAADAAGNVAPEQCILFAVYDPSGGFVTGAGLIDSPTGAYVPEPSLVGKANFGFVAKYQQGATAPIGNTQFRFQMANLSFSSTSYEWLVVSGAKAQFKGSGTINGAGDYGFLLTAIDGQVNGGGGVDKFRIKVWDRATSSTVYDNHVGATDTSDTADPVTAIAAGSIVIQK